MNEDSIGRAFADFTIAFTRIADALERAGDLTNDIVWGANCNNISELEFKAGRIADALERIAARMVDDPDEYEYRKTYIYSAKEAEKSSKDGADGSVEGLRKSGFSVCDVSDGMFTLRRPRNREEGNIPF